MKKILISLKESAYKDFITSNKKFEYRKKWPKEAVIAYVYVTGREKAILMKIKFDTPVYKTKEAIAQIAKREHKDWYENILEYFKNYDHGFAIEALNIFIISNPKNLEEMKKIGLNPPQNYMFIDDEIASWMEK